VQRAGWPLSPDGSAVDEQARRLLLNIQPYRADPASGCANPPAAPIRTFCHTSLCQSILNTANISVKRIVVARRLVWRSLPEQPTKQSRGEMSLAHSKERGGTLKKTWGQFHKSLLFLC
jgi:hypothetical protein